MENVIGDHEWDEDRKMVIKLKLPAVAMEVERSPSSKPVEECKRVCLECKREFSSGKALGGHMRIHVHKNPKLLFKKTSSRDFNNGDRSKRKRPYYMNSVNDEGKPTCFQCRKTFPSMKSLFGHMRCHPERVWRGILPPPQDDGGGGGSGGGGGDQVVDLLKFVPGWPVTDIRGRRKVLNPADNNDGVNVLLEAVEDLMSLANGGGSSMAESGVTQRKMKVIDYIQKKNSVNSLYKNPNKIKKRKKMKLMTEFAGGQQWCHWTGTDEVQAPSSQITSTGEGASQTGSGQKVLGFDLNEIPPTEEEEEEAANGYDCSSYNSNMVYFF